MSGAEGGRDLELLVASMARARGESFFPVLAEHLAQTLGARETAVCESSPAGLARTLGAFRNGAIIPNYEYDLAGSPCEVVNGGKTLDTAIAPETWPRARQGHAGYFGMPLTANDGSVLGHLCAWFEHPPRLTEGQRAVCELVANRASAELRLVHVKRERALLRGQKRQLRAEIAALYDVHTLVGQSAAHLRTLEEVRRLATAHAPVLVSGEPGTGKQLMARAIHALGARSGRPFVRIDCAAVDVDTVLAALARTLQLASGGSLYFDEIGALSAQMQTRLLSLLPRDNALDVRLIASTSRDLRAAMQRHEFNQDLFDRLRVFALDLTPLRARVEDIPPLVQHFVQRFSRQLGRRIERVDADSLIELTHHAWPGNVRELEHLIERSMVVQEGPVLKIPRDPFAATTSGERAALIAAAAGDTDFDDTLSTGLHVVQREHILRVLNSTRWVIEGNSGAALKLGLKPATLRHRMKKLGISRAQDPNSN